VAPQSFVNLGPGQLWLPASAGYPFGLQPCKLDRAGTLDPLAAPVAVGSVALLVHRYLDGAAGIAQAGGYIHWA